MSVLILFGIAPVASCSGVCAGMVTGLEVVVLKGAAFVPEAARNRFLGGSLR